MSKKTCKSTHASVEFATCEKFEIRQIISFHCLDIRFVCGCMYIYMYVYLRIYIFVYIYIHT